MPKYDVSTKDLLHRFARTLRPKQLFSRREAIEWFERKYPLLDAATVDRAIENMCVNSGSRGASVRPGRDDLFYKERRGQTRLWNPRSDGRPIYPNSPSHKVRERKRLTKEDARTLLSIAERASRIVAKTDAKAASFDLKLRGFITEESDAGGWFVQCGTLTVGGLLYGLDLCIDQYTDASPRYWFGIHASERSALKSLVNAVARQGGAVEKTLTERNVRKLRSGHYVLKKPLPAYECGKTIVESYYDEWYLGQYIEAGSQRAADVATLAANFWGTLGRATAHTSSRPASLLKAAAIAKNDSERWVAFDAQLRRLEKHSLSHLEHLYAQRAKGRNSKRMTKIVRSLGRDPLVVADLLPGSHTSAD